MKDLVVRKMPDRIKPDYSNLSQVVSQFRDLGYSDTYILNTIIAVSDVMSGKDLNDKEVNVYDNR